MTVLSPTYDRVSIAGATAIRAIVGSYRHQTQGRRTGGSSPAAVACDKTQGPDTGRGLVSPVLFSHSHRLESSPSRTRVCLIPPGQARTFSRCAGTSRARDLSRQHSGTSPTAGLKSLGHQQLVDSFADVARIHFNRLSSSPSFDGSKTIEKGLTDDEILFDAGSTSDD